MIVVYLLFVVWCVGLSLVIDDIGRRRPRCGECECLAEWVGESNEYVRFVDGVPICTACWAVSE
jgi:hypothetical protein